MVWEHFQKITINGMPKAKCLHCDHILSAITKNGTSHLKDHINLRCTRKNSKVDIRQKLLSVNRKSDGSARVENDNFSQEVSRRELANMVIMHESPLSIVDHIGFRRFVTSLNAHFKIISRNTLRADIMKMFMSEKSSLKKALESNGSRIAITTDTWTASNQRKGYMAVTCHYIDDFWVLRNKILRFAYVPCPHTKDTLAQVLLDTLNMYNIAEKVSSIVVDNCTTNDAMLDVLSPRFNEQSLMLKGKFLHLRCSAHILNLIVQDGLDVIGDGIKRIRDCVSFWAATPKRVEMFEDKDVFSNIKCQNPRLKFILPTEMDWEFAEKVCEKLKMFHKTTEIFSGRKYPTSNLFFRQVCEIKLALRSWLLSDSQLIRDMTKNMNDKFEKYWSNINGILAIAAILDPRNKLECVEFYFNDIYYDKAGDEIDRVKNLLYDLLYEYQEKEARSMATSNLNNVNGKRPISSINSNDDDGGDKWSKAKKIKTRKVNVRSELDHYLEEDAYPESEGFDILNFWHIELKYPTLQKIAKDILAIPASTVASESAFSMGGRVISPHRSRLHANTVEALMCLQNWIQGEYSGLALENAQACATILEDEDSLDMSSGGGGLSGSEVVDLDSDDDDFMDI
uniref:BED-type domain-containing protein n=1 Tax=Chenopodium quinoa TaxID=63459 RepID=A0A803M5D5_CHEQI